METTSATTIDREHDRDYDAYLGRVQHHFLRTTLDGKRPVFTTDAGDLFALYLDHLPPEDRKYHTCNACCRFFDRYAGLVTIDEQGRTETALWNEDDAPDYYRPAIAAVAKAVRAARVDGVFYAIEPVWGQPVTGTWTHYSIKPPATMLHRSPVQSAGQRRAEKHEDFKNVCFALSEFSPAHVDQALTILKADALYRSEKVLGAAEWLAALHKARAEAKGKAARENVVWLATATAPAGFCHPRSSMIGTLLEDLAAGLEFGAVSRRFAEKMHPLKYQRPQAAPSAGAIAQAEKLVEQMGIAASLRRRFARLDEIQTIWKPTPMKPAEKSGPGVFGHLAPKGKQPVSSLTLPPATLTWEKFRRVVLPDVVEIEYFVRAGSGNFTAFVTAVDPSAPPLLQWDTPERRNPVSSYVWHRGSPPSQWGLGLGYVKVTAISSSPAHWFEPEKFKHHGECLVFMLDGAKESRTDAGLALFPETLRSELHGVRSVIEAHSRSGKLEGVDEASACGVALGRGKTWQERFRVTDRLGQKREYVLDRWD